MLSVGELSRLGQVLLLGLCDADAALAEATRAALAGGVSEAEAARGVGIDRVTFRRHCHRVKGTIGRLIGEGFVEPGELVEA